MVDEHTGRVMADRSWSQGLHQLIESKEGVEITPRKESLARISYQRFFRRYLHLGKEIPREGYYDRVIDLRRKYPLVSFKPGQLVE